MITAKEIGQFIAQPEKVGSADIEELKSLSEKYPYAQIFSILYLKGMQASNSVDFEAALRTHSYRISDRAQLYSLIKEQESSTEETTLSVPIVEVEETVLPIDLTIESIKEVNEVEKVVLVHEAAEDIEEIIAPEVPIEAIVPEEIPTEITLGDPIEPTPEVEAPATEPEEVAATLEEPETPVETEEIVPEITKQESAVDEHPEDHSKTIEKPKDRLEETILHHAFAANYRLDALTEEEEKALSERLAKENAEIPEPIEVPKTEETTEQKLEVEGPQTFTNWLHSNRNYSTPETTDKDAIASVVNDFEAFDPMESLFGVHEKPKQEFYSPAKKAKESLSEKQLPVSETLAKIYLMQGNYPKAIEAYKELSLAFPEKKIFFANQIEDLNKKLNK